MKKTIVICCDGTLNTFGKSDTNVRRVFDSLDDDRYKRYYDPGLGTEKREKRLLKVSKLLSNIAGATVALGVTKKVLDAYTFLTQQYSNNTDKVFFFGFSRGAWTVRRLAKMVSVCGLPPRGNINLVPHAYAAYLDFKDKCGDKEFFKSFNDLSRECNPTFVGAWDTVRAAGLKLDRIECKMADNIECGRHALSLDERRRAFEPELWIDDDRIKQRWFAGDHSDVGGGNNEAGDVDLSYLSLHWMVKEANDFGLGIGQKKIESFRNKADNVRSNLWSKRKRVNDLSLKKPWHVMKKSPRRLEEGRKFEVDPAVLSRIKETMYEKEAKKYILEKNLTEWI